jgi:hypothetical protein
VSAGWWRLRWLFNRRVGLTLLWMLGLLAVAIAASVVGIRLAGSLEGWQRWMIDHAGLFFVWRLLLYAGTVWGWLWMRRRLRAREPKGGSHQRLLRVEIAAVLTVIALEASQFTQVK